MIQTKEDLKAYIAADNSWYDPGNRKWRLIERFSSTPNYALKKYLRYLRTYEYHYNNAKGSRFHAYMGYFYERKKNRLGRQLGIEIGPNCFGKGLSIWHYGSIVINPDVRAGEYCTLRGANCIGNNGAVNRNPVLGDRVSLGYGAVIIGDVSVADDTTIGANAVVNKTISESGCVYAGVPAKKIASREKILDLERD